MKAIYNWDKVNWLEQDIVIARELGCSKQRVNQRRKELGKSQSPNYCKHNITIFNKLLNLDTEGMCLDEISLKTGYTRMSVARILKQNNKGYIVNDRRKIGKYDWANADWTKSDKEIAYKLSVPSPAVVYQKRRKLGLIKKININAHKEINLTSSGDSIYKNVSNLVH